MSRTITALFDQRSDAEAAKERLRQSNVDADHVHIHDKSSAGYNETDYSTGTHEDRGMWASIKNAFLPDEDRHTYEEGVRRGGFLLTADVDEDQLDSAVRVLEEADTVDIDERSNQWREQGWNYDRARGASTGGDMGTTDTGVGGMAAGAMSALGLGGDRDTDRTSMRTDTSGEQVIPIVEEQLTVGKREVERGGVRVRSYVTEKPVHEQVRLRDENVVVERRTVDQPLSSADGDAFRERTISMTETDEEAVVGKTARVVEEVVVRKDVGERVEEIDDTVRRTDVEVDRDATRTTGLGGTDLDRDGYDDTTRR